MELYLLLLHILLDIQTFVFSKWDLPSFVFPSRLEQLLDNNHFLIKKKLFLCVFYFQKVLETLIFIPIQSGNKGHDSYKLKINRLSLGSIIVLIYL